MGYEVYGCSRLNHVAMVNVGHRRRPVLRYDIEVKMFCPLIILVPDNTQSDFSLKCRNALTDGAFA